MNSGLQMKHLAGLLKHFWLSKLRMGPTTDRKGASIVEPKRNTKATTISIARQQHRHSRLGSDITDRPEGLRNKQSQVHKYGYTRNH